MSRFIEAIPRLLGTGESFALALITRVKGSSPQKSGAKALFFPDGRIHGTLGGGCLEAEVQDRARQAQLSGKGAIFDLLLDHDFGWDDGLICGGKVCGIIVPHAERAAALWQMLAAGTAEVTWGVNHDFEVVWPVSLDDPLLYLETSRPAFQLWIAGSGHIAQAVAPLALMVDFGVTIFDDRPLLANHRYFPPACQLRVGSWETILTEPWASSPSFGLVVTRGHQHDALALRHWIKFPFSFLGMIGSQRKARLIFSQFVEEKIATPEEVARVHCPVGLDIEAVSPQEIAVSIIAQMIERRALLFPQAELTSIRRPGTRGAVELQH